MKTHQLFGFNSKTLALAASIAVCLASSLHAAPAKWNILFLAADDMRPQLGCYGDKIVKSPNLDRLAERGMVFNRAFCQQALCSPSRISLLSGRRPATTGIHQIGPALRDTMPDITTLPQHFKNNGWHTRSLGKIYHIGIDDPASWSVESFVSRMPRYGPEGVAAVEKRRKDYVKSNTKPPQKGEGAVIYAGPAFEAPEVDDDALTDGGTTIEGIKVLKELALKPEQPFFLAIGFANPHVPWVSPKKYWDLYNPADLKLPDNQYKPKDAPDFAAQSGADFYWYGNVPKDRKITPEFGRQCLHGYLAAISYVDNCVGRILNELDRLGLREKTIVIFWGDHGYYMGEHGWWGAKHNNYEGATRAPLIVSVPGLNPLKRHTDALAEFVDIYPSLAELAGLPLTPGLEGMSFAPLLSNPDFKRNKFAFSEYPKGGNQGTAMRTDRYRYVEWKDKEGKMVARELYDHQADPQENVNLANQASQSATLDELARTMQTEFKSGRPAKTKKTAQINDQWRLAYDGRILEMDGN